MTQCADDPSIPHPETHEVVEICAGAGGQAIGLERAGVQHAVAVELDRYACQTLRQNRPEWTVIEGDVADRGIWTPAEYEGEALLAGRSPVPALLHRRQAAWHGR